MGEENKPGLVLTDREREFAEAIAKEVMGQVLKALKSEGIVESVLTNWTGSVDKMVGRAFRRLAGFLLTGLVLIGSYKLGLIERVIQGLGK